MLNTNTPDQTVTVDEMLRDLPDSARVFFAHRTACVGCRLARFCTLAEVAGVYGLDLPRFLAELAACAQPHPKLQGVQHEKQ